MRPPRDRDKRKLPRELHELIAASRALRKRLQAERLERKQKLESGDDTRAEDATVTPLRPRE